MLYSPRDIALFAIGMQAIFTTSFFGKFTKRLNAATFRALLVLGFHAKRAVIAKLNNQKASCHTLNQALAESADEASLLNELLQ